MSTEQSGGAGPPPELVRSLVEGPSLVRAVDWHDEVGSTNQLAATLAADGMPEIHVVGAERQVEGRGRLGRTWTAPPGRSLTFSLLLRPAVPREALPLLPLFTGLVLADVTARYCRDAEVGLKWPNDLLLDGRKAAGILLEAGPDDAVVIGLGINVDWRGVQRSDELLGAVSLAELTDIPVDRWRLLAGLLGVFSQRYEAWRQAPDSFLDDYRARCLTLGRPVRVERTGAEVLVGEAVGIDGAGALEVRADDGSTVAVNAGDVWHLR